MVLFTKPLHLVLLTLLTVLTTLVMGQKSNDDPNGKQLYINSPSCNYWKCKVYWTIGQRYFVNWVNPPSTHDHLQIRLIPQDESNSLPTYTLARSVSASHHSDQCDSMGTQQPCGRFFWTVPTDTVPGEYMIYVQDLQHDNVQGYTDTVVITKKPTKHARREAKSRLIS